MSKNAKSNNLDTLKKAQTRARTRNRTEVKPVKTSLLINTSLLYMSHAIGKLSDPMHPNFRASLTPNNIVLQDTMRLVAARAVDANPGNPRAAILATAHALSGDALMYVTFYRSLIKECAFMADLDIKRLSRRIEPEAIESGIDAMGEDHQFNPIDAPLFDESGAQRAAPMERQQNDETLATSIEEAYAGIHGIQAWISMAFTKVPEEQAKKLNVDGLMPFDSRKVSHPTFGTIYVPMRDFDEYRENEKQKWITKSRTVQGIVDVNAAMAAA